MKRVLGGSLIYYLPIIANLLLTITSYGFLNASDATTILVGQFLAAAGVGVYGIIFGQATIILAKGGSLIEFYLLRVFVLAFPISLIGMAGLFFFNDQNLTPFTLLVAGALTVSDGTLLIFRSVGFTRYLNGRSKVANQLIGISIARAIISVSPAFGSIRIVLAVMVLGATALMLYAIYFGFRKGMSRRLARVRIMFQGRRVIFLLLAGYLNGIVPFLLMLGAEVNSVSDNLHEIFLLRIALAVNMLIRSGVDMMLATKKFVCGEIGLTVTSVCLTLVALGFHRAAIFMAVLPSLAYVAKSHYIHKLADLNFNRTLISPIVLGGVYLLMLNITTATESIIIAFIISTISYVISMKDREIGWHHTFLISTACMGVLLYAA